MESAARDVYNAAGDALLWPDVESAIHSKLLKMHDFISAIELTHEYRSEAR